MSTTVATPNTFLVTPRAGGRKKKREHVVGVITARALTEDYEIPRRDPRTKSGYQRDVSQARVNRLANDLQMERVDLPTAVLLNLRDFDPSENLREKDGHTYFAPGGSPLYVVDGQHRVEALRRLMNEDPDRWADFEIPFVCMLGATEREEMEEFYVVNSTAKSVRTDLALDLLKQRAETDPEVMKGLIERGESWKVGAQGLAEELAKTEIWRGRIRFPGEPRAATVITSSSMVSSLKPLLATPYFGALNRENQVAILDCFWRGVREVLRDAFDEPKEYALQKSTGVMVLHMVLISVIEYIRSVRGASLIDPKSYADVLREPLQDLEGDTSEGGVAQGPEFWRTGAAGAAGSYSSNAGQRVLTARIRGALPNPEIM